MKTYLINLDRSPERLARMDRIFRSLSLEYERVPAVDGRSLAEAEIRRHNRVAREPLSAGEIGCFLSHRAAWVRVVEAGVPHAAVMEDDLHLCRAARSFLSSDEWIPADADIVKVETNGRRIVVDRTEIGIGAGHSLTLLRGPHNGTGGYIISLDCARRLIERDAAMLMPVDKFLFNPQSPLFGSLRIYQILPALCIQELIHNRARAQGFLASQIAYGRKQDKPRLSRWEKLKRETLRLKHQLRSWIAAHRLNIFSDRIKVRVAFGGNLERSQ